MVLPNDMRYRHPTVPSRNFLAPDPDVTPAQSVDEAEFAPLMDVAGYEPLAAVLLAAYNQAAIGKGKERHAKGKPFLDQPIFEINRMLPSKVDGAAYQVMKKVQEAMGMAAAGRHEAAIHELHGAIVYSAATILLLQQCIDERPVEEP